MEVEIDPAQRTRAVALAENDREMFVERNAMAQSRAAAFERFNRLDHQGNERSLKFLGSFVDADDVIAIALHGLRHLVLKHLDCHTEKIKLKRQKGSEKSPRDCRLFE